MTLVSLLMSTVAGPPASAGWFRRDLELRVAGMRTVLPFLHPRHVEVTLLQLLEAHLLTNLHMGYRMSI
jgi:hypothetical protein